MPAELAYLAGVFDGEGWVSIGMSKPRKVTHTRRHALTAGVTNSYLPVLEEFKALFGGGISSGGRCVNFQVYKWYVSSGDAVSFLRAMQPHSRIKARQIELALEFDVRVKKTKQRVSSEELQLRDFYKNAIREARCGQQPALEK